ncbi:MAG: peptide deformylase [Phycisphaerales bacterium JB050]
MSVDAQNLRIVKYPAEVLRQKTQVIPEITEEVRQIAERMIDLMYEAEGIGLAAPQVGLNWRMFVIDIPESEDEDERSAEADPPSATNGPMVYINPTLSGFSRDLVTYEEGCLSIPRVTGEVRRPSLCTVNATNLDGEQFSHAADGLLARCLQHEFDHLEGVLMIDKFDLTTRRKIKSSLQSLEQSARVVG